MSAVSGKWKLVSSDNEEAFMKAVGYSDDFIQGAKPFGDPANDIQEEFIITETEAKEVLSMKGEVKYTEAVAIGTNVTFKDIGGRESKITTLVEDASMTTIQDFGEVTATYVVTVDGNKLTVQMGSSSGVSATREMKRV